MSSHSALSTYVPYFSAPAKAKAADRWNLPSDPCPDHERMIRAIRRLPGQESTLVDAREQYDHTSILIAKRDWHRWRQIAWANGLAVGHA